jgi:hypothetical protein
MYGAPRAAFGFSRRAFRTAPRRLDLGIRMGGCDNACQGLPSDECRRAQDRFDDGGAVNTNTDLSGSDPHGSCGQGELPGSLLGTASAHGAQRSARNGCSALSSGGRQGSGATRPATRRRDPRTEPSEDRRDRPRHSRARSNGRRPKGPVPVRFRGHSGLGIRGAMCAGNWVKCDALLLTTRVVLVHSRATYPHHVRRTPLRGFEQ